MDKLDPSKDLNPEQNQEGTSTPQNETDGRTYAEVLKSDEPEIETSPEPQEVPVESEKLQEAIPWDTSKVKDRSPASTSSTASFDNELKVQWYT